MSFGVGAGISANEHQPSATIGNNKNTGLALLRFDWRHPDVEKFTDRLIKILKPKLRTDFGRS